jgi:transglutaminase-like putative cysteine protease
MLLSPSFMAAFYHESRCWRRKGVIIGGGAGSGPFAARETPHGQRTGSRERVGVCRDVTHLAVAFCRAMNIPARYCTGYVSDIGLPPPYEAMDFAAWMEVWLGGRWRVFDARNNAPRLGRVLIAPGREAADVRLTHTFGPNSPSGFRVWIDEAVPA